MPAIESHWRPTNAACKSVADGRRRLPPRMAFAVTALTFSVFVVSACTSSDAISPLPQNAIEAPTEARTEGVPRLHPTDVAGIDRYQQTRSARLVGWIEDALLIRARTGNVAQRA